MFTKPNLCYEPFVAHWTDVCIGAMEGGGFFTTAAGEALVVFLVTFLLLLDTPFVYGLGVLWITQVINFCSGMTSMERLGSSSHRNRHFNYVEQIRETATMFTEPTVDEESKLMSSPAPDGSNHGIYVTRMDSNDDFMRFQNDDDDENSKSPEFPGGTPTKASRKLRDDSRYLKVADSQNNSNS